MSEFAHRLWLLFVAVLFTMVALRYLGVTDGNDPIAALFVVVAVRCIGESMRYPQPPLRRRHP